MSTDTQVIVAGNVLPVKEPTRLRTMHVDVPEPTQTTAALAAVGKAVHAAGGTSAEPEPTIMEATASAPAPKKRPGSSMCTSQDGMVWSNAVVPTHVIGPIIASYVIDRPSSLKLCGTPCLGPRRIHGWQKSPLIQARRWLCMCDGNGFCALSWDIGRFRTMRCTCSQVCLDKPRENWEHTAWTVVRVLKLRSRDSSQVKQVAASFSR